MSFTGIGLYCPKDKYNVGATLRAAGAYGAQFVAITGKRYKSSGADTNKAVRNIPLFHTNDLFEMIPYNCVPVAVELVENATPLPYYNHPKQAFYIFGPEDGNLGESIVSQCRDVIYVPTNFCMNLAATVNVVLYDRMSKEKQNLNQALSALDRSLTRMKILNEKHEKIRTTW